MILGKVSKLAVFYLQKFSLFIDNLHTIDVLHTYLIILLMLLNNSWQKEGTV